MQFSIDITLEELIAMDVDLRGLIGTNNGIEQKAFKLSSLTKAKAKGKRGRPRKVQPESETTN